MSPTRSAFSLMELLVVIFLVSLIAFLGIEVLQPPEKKRVLQTSALNFKQQVRALFPTQEGTLICTEACKQCLFRTERGRYIPVPITLQESVEVYTFSPELRLESKELGRFHDKKVCLAVDFYAGGGSTPLALKTPETVIALPSYLEPPKIVQSIQEAEAYLLHTRTSLQDNGAFY